MIHYVGNDLKKSRLAIVEKIRIGNENQLLLGFENK